ncbi:MAG: FAD-dependent oxidoreductase [Flavobacteriales bacterium]|nr:FAD-dependent oxidoreductase [Flavobacteriales bacterium]|tara:strand:+ start:6871 stop:7908 length:1038 start_codon:yes stop_codon:yes gene_type:complete
MKVDFIIVGQGIAGTSFAFELLRQNKSFIIIDSNERITASKVALGIYNPLVLKWFSKVWRIDEQLKYFYPFYNSLGKFLNKKIIYDIGIYKYLSNSLQQNNWMVKSAHLNKEKYMSNNLLNITNSNINSLNYYGLINFAGRIDISSIIHLFRSYCLKKKYLLQDSFSYKSLVIKSDCIKYQNINSRNIIFCEGYRVYQNPFFNLNIIPTKGEVVIFNSKKLKLDKIIHSGALIVPLGNDQYAIGSTYNLNDSTNHITRDAKDHFYSILKSSFNCTFEFINHYAGVRPATIDRKPIIGSHFKYKNMFVLNGLGSRGVMYAPYLSKVLINSIYSSSKIDDELQIYRN